MENTQLIAILPTLISNAYKQGYLDCMSLLRNLPPVSYNQAEKMYGCKKMKEFTKNVKLVRSGAGEKTPYLFNVADLERKNQELQALQFINKI